MSSCKRRLAWRLLLGATLAATPLAAHAEAGETAQLLWLDDPEGTFSGSYAYDVSADGSVVVGFVDGPDGNAFRWSEASGITLLPTTYGQAEAISGDGSTIVGYHTVFAEGGAGHIEAFRWTEAGGVQNLGTSGYTSSHAAGVSSDGSTLVGSVSGAGRTVAFAWTEDGGMQLLGWLDGGGPFSLATDVSDEGTLVGYGRMAIGGAQGFYGKVGSEDGLLGLGFFGGGNFSRATAITRDGGTIVGIAEDADGTGHAVRWSRAGEGYGSAAALDGGTGWTWSEAFDVSADGTIAVGTYVPVSESEGAYAFRWTEAGGAVPLAEWLAASGVATGDWSLTEATAISDDGSTIVGWGESASGTFQAFVARAGLLVGTLDYTESVASLQEVAHRPSALAQARILNRMPRMTGMPGLSLSFEYDLLDGRVSGLSGASLTLRRPGWMVTGGAGYVDAKRRGLYGGGRAGYEGLWLGGAFAADLGKVLAVPALSGLELGASLAFQDLDVDVKRAYLNGETFELAHGDTQARDVSGAARLQWHLPVGKGVELAPYAQVMIGRGRLSGYAEEGGAGAGLVSRQVNVTHLATLGASIEARPLRNVAVSLDYGFNHLTRGDAAPVAVTIPEAATFAVPAGSYQSDWHAIRGEVTWQPAERIELSAYATSNRGGDYAPAWTLGGTVRFGL